MFVTLQRIKPTAYGDCFPFLENESICYRSLFLDSANNSSGAQMCIYVIPVVALVSCH